MFENWQGCTVEEERKKRREEKKKKMNNFLVYMLSEKLTYIHK
jgi:hypothetical protein